MRILTLGIIVFVLVASICVSQAVEPKLLWSYTGDADRDIADVAISADGEYVAAGSISFDDDVDEKVYFFNRKGKLLWSHKISDYCRSIVVSADGEYVAVGNPDEVYFFNRKGKLLWSHRIYHGKGDGISEVAVSADGEYVAVGNIAKNYCWPHCGDPKPTIYLFNRAGELLWSYETCHGVYDIAISADGEYIAAGSSRGLESSSSKRFEPLGELYFFNREGKLLWFYKGDLGSCVKHIAISADGEYIAAGDDYGHPSKVYFFNKAGELLWGYNIGDSVFSLSMSADGEYIAVGDSNSPHSKVYFFNRTGELLWSYELCRNPTYVSVSANGEYIAAGRPYSNDTLYFFNRAGEILWSYKTDSRRSEGISVTADGRYVVNGYGEIYFLDSQVIATPSPCPTSTPESPSYELIFAIGGVLTVACLLLRRTRDRVK